MDTQPILNRFSYGWGKYLDVPQSWLPTLIELDQDLAAIDPDYEIRQVKEKFGSLRFYASTTSTERQAEFRNRITEAEIKIDMEYNK